MIVRRSGSGWVVVLRCERLVGVVLLGKVEAFPLSWKSSDGLRVLPGWGVSCLFVALFFEFQENSRKVVLVPWSI